MAGVLEEVGVVQGVVWNQRTGRLVDGHLRLELAKKRGEKTVVATVVDLSEQTGRICRAIDISPGFCAVALQRWVDATGGVPELANG